MHILTVGPLSKLAAFTDYENWYLLESIYLGVEFLVASNEVNVSSDGRFEVQCVANGVQKNDITQRTAVEDDLGHSALLGQQVHSTFRWVDALAQCVEFERAVDGHPVGSPPTTRRSDSKLCSGSINSGSWSQQGMPVARHPRTVACTCSTRAPTMPCQSSGCCPYYILICFINNDGDSCRATGNISHHTTRP